MNKQLNTLLFLLAGLGLLLSGCESARCNDGIRNGDETEIDCGGSCGECYTCEDGIQNQGETRVDCGGEGCAYCPDEWEVLHPAGPLEPSQHGLYTTIHFADDNVGLLGGYQGFLAKTTDGGQQWQDLTASFNRRDFDISSVHAHDAANWIVTGNYRVGPFGGDRSGFIRFTHDGGQTWREWAAEIPVIAHEAVVTGPQTAFATAWLRGTTHFNPGLYVIRTFDGGESWQRVYGPLYGIDAPGLFFLSPEIGWFTAGLHSPSYPEEPVGLYYTGDGGNSWAKLSNLDFQRKSVQFLTPSFGYAFDSQYNAQWDNSEPELWTTSDGGRTWQPEPLPTDFATRSTFGTYVQPDTALFFRVQDYEGIQSWRRPQNGAGGWTAFGVFNQVRAEAQQYANFYRCTTSDHYVICAGRNNRIMRLRLR